MRLTIILSLLVLLISCNEEVELTEGAKITSIDRHIISNKDGASLKLSTGPEDHTYYLIRHAEKDTIPPKNPVLNGLGYSRSYHLAEMFKKTRLDKVYSTLYNRTMHTVDSLVQTKGIETNIYQPGGMKKLSEEILESTEDRKVLIVGHSNTIPGMVNLLMGEMVLKENIDESVYDNFYVINVPKGKSPTLYHFRY